MGDVATAPEITEEQFLALNESGVRCELIDGEIVRKFMGAPQGYLGARIIFLLNVYLATRRLGFVYGADAPVRFAPQTIYIPDVAFTARSRCPGGKLPRDQVATVIPNLAIEVLSPSNRRGEMGRKIAAYFEKGVELVWVIDPDSRTATAYTSPDTSVVVGPGGGLDGGTVLPGFALPLAALFEEFD